MAWHYKDFSKELALADAGRNRVDSIEELLETLVAVGQARRTDDGRYVN